MTMNARAQQQTIDLAAIPVAEDPPVVRPMPAEAQARAHVEAAPVRPLAPAKQKLSWRAERRRRRKMRHRFEELVAWIVVPLILIGLYWAATAAMQFLGTTPSEIYEQLLQLKAALQKRG